MADVEPGEKTGVYYMPICNVRSQLSADSFFLFSFYFSPSSSFLNNHTFFLYCISEPKTGRPNKFGTFDSCPLAHRGRTSRTGSVLIATWTTWNYSSRVPRVGFAFVEKKTSTKHGVSLFSVSCLPICRYCSCLWLSRLHFGSQPLAHFILACNTDQDILFSLRQKQPVSKKSTSEIEPSLRLTRIEPIPSRSKNLSTQEWHNLSNGSWPPPKHTIPKPSCHLRGVACKKLSHSPVPYDPPYKLSTCLAFVSVNFSWFDCHCWTVFRETCN